ASTGQIQGGRLNVSAFGNVTLDSETITISPKSGGDVNVSIVEGNLYLLHGSISDSDRVMNLSGTAGISGSVNVSIKPLTLDPRPDRNHRNCGHHRRLLLRIHDLYRHLHPQCRKCLSQDRLRSAR